MIRYRELRTRHPLLVKISILDLGVSAGRSRVNDRILPCREERKSEKFRRG